VKGTLRTLMAPLVLLAIVLLLEFKIFPGFYSLRMQDGHIVGSLIDVLNRAAPVVILSAGMVLVIATGGVDLSVGAVMAIAGAVAAHSITKFEAQPGSGSPLWRAILLGLGSGSAAGLVNAILVSVIQIQPIVATLILMVAGRGIAQLICDGQILTFQNPQFAAMGSGWFLGFPIPVWIALVVVLSVFAVTRFTSLGVLIESVGANAEASRLAGVNVRMVKGSVYVFCGILAALAGLIMTADIKAADANNAGMYFELDAILAVALGGTSLQGGRYLIGGTVLGAILMQILTTTVNTLGVEKSYTLILKALVVIIVCVLHSPKVKRKLELKAATQ